GARALGYLGLFQVTRRKGETLSGRYRSNGYTPNSNTLLQPPPKTNTITMTDGDYYNSGN
ncbi:hypothetical protein, partial [Pseudomonas sp. GM78]|uniref:hypothetical protein n=1 Tax=Pseudomonas sp. GM78 TaxID=1144337 RepID=UPI001EE681B0